MLETLSLPYVRELKQNSLNTLNKIVDIGKNKTISFMAWRAKHFALSTKIHYANNFDSDCRHLIEEGYQIFIYGNHQERYDGLLHARVSRKILDIADECQHNAHNKGHSANNLEGFRMLIAISLNNGKQGDFLKQFFNNLSPYLEQNGVEPVFIARQEDIKQFDESNDNANATEKILRAKEEHKGLDVLPEAVTMGGKRKVGAKTREEINGLQLTYRDRFAFLWIKLTNQEKVAFIPVSIHGSFRIFDPHLKLPTPHALLSAMIPIIPPPYVDMFVGSPITNEQVIHSLSQYSDTDIKSAIIAKKRSTIARFAGDYLMGLVASCIPSVARGPFNDNELYSRFLIENHPHQP